MIGTGKRLLEVEKTESKKVKIRSVVCLQKEKSDGKIARKDVGPSQVPQTDE